MKKVILPIFILSGFLYSTALFSQLAPERMIMPDRVMMSEPKKGTVSFGVRSTISAFDSDGVGLGTGGQFRIQFGDRVNSDWFADYITINAGDGIRSTYYHVGWSVLFYPINTHPRLLNFQPYIAAGHCFDYNRKTVMNQPEISKGRWGSAAQAGIGTHFLLTRRIDITLSSLYMVHLTKELSLERHHDGEYEFHEHSHNALQGHLLTTLSINYKINRR